MRAAIVGASGFTGAELLRLCSSHPELEVVVAGAESQAGRPVREVYPSLGAAYPKLSYAKVTADDLRGLDVVFLSLPHGESQHLVPELLGSAGVLVDLSGDFRLESAAQYQMWYRAEHACPQLLGRFVCGLPELNREALVGARTIAVPGCYPTAAGLALTPLVRSGLADTTGVVVDAASGVSGAGRALSETSHFNAVDENFVAYGLLDHRHTPEIEHLTGAQILFTPHLSPMNRGILATCYARVLPRADGGMPTTQDVLDVLCDAYGEEPFVVVSDRSPTTKATLGSNCAHVTARVDPRTGFVLSICALDNLVKGASGQALQCANIALGLTETAGLPLVGLYP
jgi:N-acetyl-gamma-glutamyl-phosphate reductase